MHEHPIDPGIRKIWKSYPLRISGPGPCRRCGGTTALVQSMEGGFVTANCTDCGAKDTLSNDGFRKLGLWVACPSCHKRMVPSIVDKNYAYACNACERYITLAALLPRWEDL